MNFNSLRARIGYSVVVDIRKSVRLACRHIGTRINVLWLLNSVDVGMFGG